MQAMEHIQKLEKASLNKLIGEGFSEVIQDEDDIRQCTGMIRFDEEVPPELVRSFEDRVAVEFTGTVYDHDRDQTSVETFPVSITEIETDASYPTVRFTAEEDPFIERKPARRL
jgi:hypothetical protein